MRRILILTLWLCSSLSFALSANPLSVTSPDRSIAVVLSTDSSGAPQMLVKVDGRPFLQVLHMGLEGFPSQPLTSSDSLSASGFHIVQVRKTHRDRRWNMPWGENKKMREHFNGCVVTLRNDSTKVCLTLEVRVFDDGLGFRYRYNTSSLAPQLWLTGESTTFQMLGEGVSWSIPANFESYEFLYRQQPIGEVEDANTPFTFQLADGTWGSIHEAALVGMPEMTLTRGAEQNSLRSWLCPDNSGTGTVALVGDSITTSWRTITIGRRATDLVNSSLILNLNEPCADPKAPSFRPMKYIGIWWGMHLGINSWTPDERHGAITQRALSYVDFAAQNNIDAVLFEGWNQGWEQWGGNQEFSFTKASPDFDIDSVLRYARQRDVEVIIHHETGGNIPHYEQQLDSALRWCRERQIKAIKTGYAGGFPDRQLHHSQYGVEHYLKVTQKAYQSQIALDVHEPIKPTGLRRTYPNLMSAEGGRGMEWNAWSDGNPPVHQTILPFTRLLAGPMDYTPGIFDITYQSLKNHPDCRQWNQKDARQCRVPTTIGHQVALWVVLYSPLQMAADLIENYKLPASEATTDPQQTEGSMRRDSIHPMFEFFREYDPDCDWSEALDGEPGQYFAVVRRAGNRYFLGAVTNEEGRKLSLPTSFLQRGRRYRITLYGDAPGADYQTSPTSWEITSHEIRRGDVINLMLAPGGGCAAVIEPLSLRKNSK